MRFLDCGFLLDLQTFHQPAELLWGQIQDFLFCPRPLEATVRKALIQKEESVSFPDKAFDPVGPASAEKEQDILVKWMALCVFVHDGRKTFNPGAEIRVPADKINLAKTGGIIQHGGSPAILLPAIPGRCVG